MLQPKYLQKRKQQEEYQLTAWCPQKTQDSDVSGTAEDKTYIFNIWKSPNKKASSPPVTTIPQANESTITFWKISLPAEYTLVLPIHLFIRGK